MAWLATHIIEHFRFTKDIKFARENYRIIKDASLFFIDFLMMNNNEKWITCPTVSPENTYIAENGQKGSLCAGPAMDIQIIKHLWQGFIEISDALKKNNYMLKKITEMIIDLPVITSYSIHYTKLYESIHNSAHKIRRQYLYFLPRSACRAENPKSAIYSCAYYLPQYYSTGL